MSKFSPRVLMVVFGNIFVFAYLTLVRSSSVDVISFYLFCLNMFLAFMTKENRSFASFRGINDNVRVRNLTPLQDDVTNVNNIEEVEKTLGNFQETRNYVGVSFFICGAVALVLNIINIL